MPDPMIFRVASLEDFDGILLDVGVDYGIVTISAAGRNLIRVSQSQCESLAAILEAAGARAVTGLNEPGPLDDEPTP